MKRKNIFKIVICIILLVTVFIGSIREYVFASTNDKEVTFQYPITPEMEEWAFYTHVELVEMLQIPEDILHGLSTEDLVTIVLDYPYFADIHFFDTYQKGFESVSSSFNGLQELMTRDDAGIYLLDLLKRVNGISISKNAVMNNLDSTQDYYTNSFLAILLAQDSIRNTLSASELSEVNTIMLQNSNKMKKNQDSYNKFTKIYYDVLNEQTKEESEDASEISIQPFLSSMTLRTPNNSPLLVYVFESGDYDDGLADDTENRKYIKANYPNTTIVDSSTSRYNCHSYAWFGYTSNLWLNDPSPFWKDGSYYNVSYNNPTAVGQIIYYPYSGNEHSGIVRSLTGNSQIESKWGAGPRVKHKIGDCPYALLPSQTAFYTR